MNRRSCGKLQTAPDIIDKNRHSRTKIRKKYVHPVLLDIACDIILFIKKKCSENMFVQGGTEDAEWAENRQRNGCICAG